MAYTLTGRSRQCANLLLTSRRTPKGRVCVYRGIPPDWVFKANLLLISRVRREKHRPSYNEGSKNLTQNSNFKLHLDIQQFQHVKRTQYCMLSDVRKLKIFDRYTRINTRHLFDNTTSSLYI